MTGKDGQRFGPRDSATRAETAAVLHRFVGIIMDQSIVQGWTQNDSGLYLYYQDGKPVTGWKQIEEKWYWFDPTGIMEYRGWRQIDGKWYYFYADGSMAINTRIDGWDLRVAHALGFLFGGINGRGNSVVRNGHAAIFIRFQRLGNPGDGDFRLLCGWGLYGYAGAYAAGRTGIAAV